MRAALAAIAAVIGCVPARDLPDPATAFGPGLDGVVACKSVVRILDVAATYAASPEQRRAVRTLTQMHVDWYTDLRAISDRDRILAGEECVDTLDEIHQQLRALAIPPLLNGLEQKWIQIQRTRRTGIPEGLDSGSIHGLEREIGWRDEECACKDRACLMANFDRFFANGGGCSMSKHSHGDFDNDTFFIARTRIKREADRCTARIHAADPP